MYLGEGHREGSIPQPPSVTHIGQLCLFSLLHTLISRRELRETLKVSTIAPPTRAFDFQNPLSFSSPNRENECDHSSPGCFKESRCMLTTTVSMQDSHDRAEKSLPEARHSPSMTSAVHVDLARSAAPLADRPDNSWRALEETQSRSGTGSSGSDSQQVRMSVLVSFSKLTAATLHSI